MRRLRCNLVVKENRAGWGGRRDDLVGNAHVFGFSPNWKRGVRYGPGSFEPFEGRRGEGGG